MIKYRFRTLIICAMIPALLCSCRSSGGSSDGTAVVEEASLSSMSAFPGEFVTISHSSITPSKASDVSFTYPDGSTMSASVEDTYEGYARLAVPFYVDPSTGRNAGTKVTVSVNGHEVDGDLTIQAVPDLGIQAGMIQVYILQKTIESYNAALTSLENQIFIEVGSDQETVDKLNLAKTELESRIAHCQGMITQIQTGSLSVTINGGQTVTLTQEELLQADKWLATWFIGMGTALQASSKATGKDAPNFFGDDWLNISADERYQRIRQSIDYVIQETERGVDWSKVYIGGVTISCSAAGFMVGGPAGAAIGGVAGFIVSSFSAGYELGTAALMERIHESFSGLDREAYDYANQALEQLERVVLSAGGSLEGALGYLLTLISSGVTIDDSIEAAERARCETDSKALIYAGPTSKATVDDFCSGDTGSASTSAVSFADPSGDWNITINFTQDIMTTAAPAVIEDDDAYNNEWVRIVFDGYPADPYAWDLVPVTITATGGSIKEMRIYSASNNWDPASRNPLYTILTPGATVFSLNATRYYWLYIYTEDPNLPYAYTMQIFRLYGE